ncbi:MAG: hypothetical protein GY753_12775 [Gammaproteobacteria bacterium]|nr:hypothetical protein [Gammaproteobacteria bacterium]
MNQLTKAVRRSIFPGNIFVSASYALSEFIFDFDPSKADFTARMAKRLAPGPFDAAPIVQGRVDGTGEADKVYVSQGGQIDGEFHENFDNYRGSIVFWITPEWDGDDGRSHWILDDGATHRFSIYKRADGMLRFLSVGAAAEVDISSGRSGGTHCIVVRWDSMATLDGTNHMCISVDGYHVFGNSTGITLGNPLLLRIGGRNDTANSEAVDAIVEGITIYRRPLFDGTYGHNAGLGDEIELIYAGGSGRRPEEVTGWNDICFQFATDGSQGELVSGLGEAWGWPWASNELSNWHMQSAASGAPDDWTAVNAPVLGDGAGTDVIYGVRTQKISVDSAGEGIKQAFGVTEGETYWAGAWVRAGGLGQGLAMRVYDATGSADVAEVITDSGSWVQLETCFEVPAGCTTIELYIESSDAATYDIHLAQVQVLQSAAPNGGMEGVYNDLSGGGAGTINVADGWDTNCETDGTDTLDKETVIVHSGAASQKVQVAEGGRGIYTDGAILEGGKWNIVSMWLYGAGGSVRIADGTLTELREDVVPPVGVWTYYSFAFWATEDQHLVFISLGGGATFYVDDVSVIKGRDVALGVTPAPRAESTESTGIRVDGMDTLVQPITRGLSARSGQLRWNWTPRHDGVGGLPQVIAYFNGDSANFIVLYWSDASVLRLAYKDGGTQARFADWNTPLQTAGNTYDLRIKYSATQMHLTVDGVIRIVIEHPAGVDFDIVPTEAYLGSSNIGLDQGDGTFAAP